MPNRRDFIKSTGLDPDSYASEPYPDALGEPIFGEEAIDAIIDGNVPSGRPAEAGGAIEHLQKLVEFAQSENFGFLTPQGVEIFKAYATQTQGRAQAQQRQQSLAQAAQGFQAGAQGSGQGGRPAESTPGQDELTGQPQVSGGGELLDESLPSAGGGGNA